MMDSHPGPTDQQAEEALRRTRAGDTKAFATTVARYELPIQAWLASVGGPSLDLDGVA